MASEKNKTSVSSCPKRRLALNPGPVPEGTTHVDELTKDDQKRLTVGKKKKEWPELPTKEAVNFRDAEPVLILNWDPEQNPKRFKRLQEQYPELKKDGYQIVVKKNLYRVTSMDGGTARGAYWLPDDPSESNVTSEQEFRSKYAVKEEWNDSDRFVTAEVVGREDHMVRPGVTQKKEAVIKCWMGKTASQPVEGHKDHVWKGGGEQLYIPNTIKTGKGLGYGDAGVKSPPWKSEADKEKKQKEQARREVRVGIKRGPDGEVIKRPIR